FPSGAFNGVRSSKTWGYIAWTCDVDVPSLIPWLARNSLAFGVLACEPIVSVDGVRRIRSAAAMGASGGTGTNGPGLGARAAPAGTIPEGGVGGAGFGSRFPKIDGGAWSAGRVGGVGSVLANATA